LFVKPAAALADERLARSNESRDSYRSVGTFWVDESKYCYYNYIGNMKLEFTWDLAKEKINQRKHDVSFEEAKTVFLDDEAF